LVEYAFPQVEHTKAIVCCVTPGCNPILAKAVSIFKIFDVRHGS
jgi:hypothetical protein